MLRDNLVELIEPMLNSAGANPLALTHHRIQASGDRLPCLENPRPDGAESSLTENVTSPLQAEPAQGEQSQFAGTVADNLETGETNARRRHSRPLMHKLRS